MPLPRKYSDMFSELDRAAMRRVYKERARRFAAHRRGRSAYTRSEVENTGPQLRLSCQALEAVEKYFMVPTW